MITFIASRKGQSDFLLCLQVLDFGILASGQKRTKLITLYNSMEDPVALVEMAPRESDNRVTVDFSKTVVVPDSPSYFNVTLQSGGIGKNTMGEAVTGTLLIRTNRTTSDSSITKVKYKAMVLDGSLGYNASDLFFLIGDQQKAGKEHMILRSVEVHNHACPHALHSPSHKNLGCRQRHYTFYFVFASSRTTLAYL